MNAFVKKEIRSLLPDCLAVLVLAIILPWVGTDWDVTFAWMPGFIFLGLILLAVDSFGREFHVGTLQLLLSQPIERKKIWRLKIFILSAAVALILIACFISSGFVFLHELKIPLSGVNWSRFSAAFFRGVFIAIMTALVAMAGGLWTTLLFRQIATALWIAFLAPIGLAMVIIFFLPNKASDETVAIIFIIAATIYSLAGFLLARKLFYCAQDAAWTGGVINFSRWRYFESGSESFSAARHRRPIRALFRKEFQLHSIALIGAGVLLGMHVAVFFLRALYTNSHRNSTMAVISDFFWVLWLVMPLLIGCMAVAEERKLGVTDEQFCLPASRRLQFIIKFFPTMFFGILFGGIMPLLLETIARHLGDGSEIFTREAHSNNYSMDALFWFKICTVSLSAGFALAAFFASTLAKNFLQALSITIITIVGSTLFVSFVSWVNREHSAFLGITLWHSILPILIALLVMPITLIGLAYLNFNHFQESKRLWRRNVLGISGTLLLVIVSSVLIYNRAWEIFEPAEPPHGATKLSLANPPKINAKGGITILMPDGRAWLDYEGIGSYGGIKGMIHMMLHPMPENEGPAQFIQGSNWVDVVTDAGRTVGLKSDGTIWISRTKRELEMTNATSESDWMTMDKRGYYSGSIDLLKTNHTLWEWSAMLASYPSYKDKPPAPMPVQVGTNSDWAETFLFESLLRKTDGTVWQLSWDEHRKMVFNYQTNFDDVNFQTLSSDGNGEDMAYIGKDGRLMVFNWYWAEKLRVAQIFRPCGFETNWVSVAVQWHTMTALKSDGTLWQWKWNNASTVSDMAFVQPTRLGIHNDWVAMAGTSWWTITVAADGGVWLWFDPESFYGETLMKSPKQPQFLGNVFGKGN